MKLRKDSLEALRPPVGRGEGAVQRCLVPGGLHAALPLQPSLLLPGAALHLARHPRHLHLCRCVDIEALDMHVCRYKGCRYARIDTVDIYLCNVNLGGVERLELLGECLHPHLDVVQHVDG